MILKQRLLKYLLMIGVLVTAAACERVGSEGTAPQPGNAKLDALVITHGFVIDGTGAEPVSNGMVVIQEGRIMAVGPMDPSSIPLGATILDVQGATVLPGIINAHVHTTSSPAIRRDYFLLKGVTSTCDLGSPYASMTQFPTDPLSGPAARGFRSGPIISVPGGYPDTVFRNMQISYPVSTQDQARAALDVLVKRGADVIKIALEPGYSGNTWPMLSLEQVSAIVEEAHKRGKLVRAHLAHAEVVDIALDAGVDVFEHIPVPSLSAEEWQFAVQDSDSFQFPSAYEQKLARMVEQKVILVPTMSMIPTISDQYEVPPEYKDQTFKRFVEPVRRFHSLGGVIALGNDYGNPGVESGMPLQEMQWLIEAGLSPMEVIQAATQHAAFVCGHGSELGTLEPGKFADILVLDGNPLADIQAMNKVVLVILDGKIVFSQE